MQIEKTSMVLMLALNTTLNTAVDYKHRALPKPTFPPLMSNKA
jgi:hypothetical protein